MDSEALRCKAAMLLGAICMLLSVQGVGAQVQYTNSTGVPGWGIALLTMMSIMTVIVLCLMMIIPCWCRKTKDDCQNGISFYSPHTMFGGGDACQVACQSTCQPAFQPACQPACPPVCQPVCQPAIQPTCKPASQSACQTDSQSICQSDCQSECQSTSQTDFPPVCKPQC
ncbi:proline-rich protein 9 [Mantella aurantiaca]